jgi:hypothetical protein
MVDGSFVLVFRKKTIPPPPPPQPVQPAVPVAAPAASSNPLAMLQALMQGHNPAVELLAAQLPSMVTPDMLQILLDMGFSIAAGTKALILNMLNTELAAQWLIENIENPDLETPLTAAQMREIARNMGMDRHEVDVCGCRYTVVALIGHRGAHGMGCVVGVSSQLQSIRVGLRRRCLLRSKIASPVACAHSPPQDGNLLRNTFISVLIVDSSMAVVCVHRVQRYVMRGIVYQAVSSLAAFSVTVVRPFVMVVLVFLFFVRGSMHIHSDAPLECGLLLCDPQE